MIYVIGGAGGDDMATELDDLYVFNIGNKTWSPMTEATGLERYDAAGAAVGSYLAVFGGHGKGNFHNDLYYFYVET